jgi:Ca-activated chloride channel family protein
MRKKMRFGSSGRRRLSVAAGAVVLAFGAIVLARAQGSADVPAQLGGAPVEGGGAQEGPARIAIATPEVEGFLALTQGAVLAHGTRELFAELRLQARTLEGETERRPVALAVVLDTSGSMTGEKIEQAKRSVLELLERMHADDRIAIVAYGHEAAVVQPLARVADVRPSLSARIREIYASGGTNIPAGLSLGAQALASAPSSMSHRLVLVSDGLDGSGLPLVSLQSEVVGRANGGTTTSALGVGTDYDERWLTTVADAGRGNYEFLARGGELSAFLTRELEQASSTVADQAFVRLDLPAGWRIAEVYGARADGGTVPLGALFAGERRRVTLRMEIDADAPGSAPELHAALGYRAPAVSADRNLDLGRLSVSVVTDDAQVVASRDVALHAEAVAQHVDARQAQAVEAWRRGDGAMAEQLSQANITTLERMQREAPRPSRQVSQQIEAANADLGNFRGVAASSEQGRAWGLRSNAARRARAEAF